MTGGDVVMSTTAEAVQIYGRVSSAGVKVAPSTGAGKWTCSKVTTGQYSIVFTEAYAQFLGCQPALEAASGIIRVESFTATSKTLLIYTFAVDGTTATDKAFSFTANFTESLAP